MGKSRHGQIGVYSEVNKLERVFVHRPGSEIENMTPELMERLLFDDIPYLKVAREEHDEFVKILRANDTEVVYLIDAMADIISDDKIKEEFINKYLDESGVQGEGIRESIKEYLYGIPDLKALISKMISGIYKSEVAKHKHISLADIINDPYPFAVDPMPNLYFTRDPACVIGSSNTVNCMRNLTRRRETIFTDYLFKHHELFSRGDNKAFYSRDESLSIEGGDILVLSDKLIAIGISERTDVLAIEKLAKRIFMSEEPFDTILAFMIPDKRAFMHLDTVFTMVDKNAFTMHHEIDHVLKIYSITCKSNKIEYKEESKGIKEVLKEHLGLDEIKLIKCGAGEIITAAREQWNDGSNTLAIAPGEVIVYERNYVTNRKLEEAGIKLHRMPSSELSRGRGGPRCMSMPLLRK